MTDLRSVLNAHVEQGSLPGAVGLVARGDQVEVAAVGTLSFEAPAPMARDSLFRIASITKPITSAAALMLVDDGRIALDEPVRRWLPELAAPSVVRDPAGPIEDVVPATNPITLFDVLTSRAGYGFASDFSLPAIQPLLTELLQGPPQPRLVVGPDEWMARLSRIPLLHQPGEGWLYNACYDILGVLIARVAGRPLPEFLAERIFEPLGMVDTGFDVEAADLGRLATFYRPGPAGGLELVDAPDGQWSAPPAFPSGAAGLVSTIDDWYAFARMLLAGGGELLSADAVQLMMTDHLTQDERDAGTLFLEGQGWGFGGSVDVQAIDPWNVPGRYGWVGGTGTSAHITPSTGDAAILLTQIELSGPTAPALMREVWRYAAT